jgi:cytochrome c1
MPPPLTDGAVTFLDEAPNTAVAMAHDVTTFLTWAAEPRMEQRKQTGLKVMLFLLVLAGLMYMVKRKVWANVPH